MSILLTPRQRRLALIAIQALREAELTRTEFCAVGARVPVMRYFVSHRMMPRSSETEGLKP